MEIKTIFGDTVTRKELFDRDKLGEVLYKNFKNITSEQLVNILTNKFDQIVQYALLQNGQNTCQLMSLLFNPHRLGVQTLKVFGGDNSKYYIEKYGALYRLSLFDLMIGENNKKWWSGLARAFIFQSKRKNKINTSEILNYAIQLGVDDASFAYEFLPHVARNIYKEYYCNSKSRILDPCAGWGGRMIGASVVGNRYTCFEPSTKTYKGLKELYRFLQTLNPDFKTKIINKCFEDVKLKKEFYDFALTSPPYYNTEIYCDEETNSCNRYNTFEKWCDGFYLPLVGKTMNSLKSGKVFVINISDRKYPLNTVLLQNFKKKYKIRKMKGRFSGKKGLRKVGEGEMFYAIHKE